jgi:CRISPR/Cas system-associated protein Cas7 (RAMP superfamily)
MNIDPNEAKKNLTYRVVSKIHGDLKNKFLDDCIKGEKPAHIVRQALKEYYDKRNNRSNNSY